MIVLFHEEVRPSDLDLLRSKGFEGGHVYENIPAVWTVGPADAVPELERHHRVDNVEKNREITLSLSSSTKAAGAQASPADPGAREEFGLTGDDVTVAVIDTGIDADHPDLPFGEKVVANKKAVTPTVENLTEFRPDAFEMSSYRTNDEYGHGTHVAGTACGSGAASDGQHAGVAPDCKLVGVDVFEGRSSLTAVIAFGLDWVIEHQDDYDIRVASNSWGGGGEYREDGMIETLISRMAEERILPVFAAGNAGPDEGTVSPYAKAPEAVGVANYDDRTGLMAPSSSRGVPDDPFRSPDVAAPGTDITAPLSASTGRPALGNYTQLTGTSMATPHVSGAAALLLEADPSLTPDQLKQLLTESADPDLIRTSTEDGERPAQHYEQGAGALDAYDAAALATGDATVDASISDDGPFDDPVVTEDTVTVTGTRNPVDAALRDGGFPVTGENFVFHDLGPTGLNPTGFTGAGFVVSQGESIVLQTRYTVSGHPDFPFDAATDARFRITDPSGDVTYVDAAEPHESLDSTDSGAPYYRVSTDWDVPADAEPGTHTFALEARTGPLDSWVTGPVNTFDVQASPVSPPTPVEPTTPVDGPETPSQSGPPPGSDVDNPVVPDGNFSFPDVNETVFFEDDLESFDPGYSAFNDGTGAGVATDWTYVGDGAPFITVPHSGQNAYYVGVSATGAESGYRYTDDARAGLVLPTIDLSEAGNATFSYWLSGASEEGYDFLRVETKASDEATWNLEAQHSGSSFNWTRETVNLTDYAGDEVQIRFVFDSDFIYPFGTGWHVDDLRVVGGEVDDRPPTAQLEANATFGTSSVEFTVDGEDPDAALTNWTLDFGDGSSASGTSFPATVEHTYSEEAIHDATLTVNDAAGSQDTDDLTINTVQSVQVNAGDGWVTATDTSSDGDWSTWEADLDLSDLDDGAQTLQTRYPDGTGGFHADADDFVLARDPVVRVGETPLVEEGANATLEIDVVSPSGNHTTEWDLDGDGNFSDASGENATTNFSEAGQRSVDVRVTDENATRVTNATVPVDVFEVRTVLDATGTILTGVPEEASTTFTLGEYDPAVSQEKETYLVNVTLLRDLLEGEILALEGRLGWSEAFVSQGDASSDLDLWVEKPDGNVSAQGASLANPEVATFQDPDDGVYKLHVEPFLVFQPTDYRVSADLHVLPTDGS